MHDPLDEAFPDNEPMSGNEFFMTQVRSPASHDDLCRQLVDLEKSCGDLYLGVDADSDIMDDLDIF